MDVWGWARVQMAGWSILKESRTEPAAMAIRHGHVPSRGIDDVASAIGVVVLWAVVSVVSWWRG